MKFVLWLCVALAILIGCQGEGMTEVFRWRQIDYYNRGELETGDAGSWSRPGVFTYPSGHYRGRRAAYGGYSRYTTSPVAPTPSSSPANSSSFIQYNNVPMGVSQHKGRLFVTVPRRRPGIPSTLNYIDLQRDGNNPSPKLRAYPDFDTNYLSPDLQPNPNRLVSVYRTSVDECNRFWFIDTGILEYPGNQTPMQRPAIWVIDLKRDRRLLRFEIPAEIAERGNGLASITVDVKGGDCSNTYAYIPDLVNRRLHVFDLTAKDMWSFTHSYFNFDPEAAQLNIAGQSLRFNDGIFSTTLGPRDRSGYRDLYFHPLASTNEFAVNTAVLQRRENTLLEEEILPFRLLGSRGQARQSTMHEYDPKTKVIFYNEIQRNGVGCWNTKKPFSPENHGSVIQDAERMIYPSDLTIDQEGSIWVMSNSMPLFIASQLDVNAFNFRIWKRDASAAAQDTVCE